MPVNLAQDELRSLAERIQLENYLPDDPPVGARRSRSADQPQTPRALLEKLLVGETLTEAETTSLEVFVLQTARPAIRTGDLQSAGPHWAGLLIAHEAQINSVVAAVGRISLPSVPGLSFSGTGFLVGANLFMTSRRVAEVFTIGVGKENVGIRPGWSAEVDFATTRGDKDDKVRKVTNVVMIHPALDMALLSLSPAQGQVYPLKLSTISADDLVDRDVICVGYAAGFTVPQASHLAAIFGNPGEDKYLFPGRVDTPQIVDSYGHQIWALTHDCSTIFSNSGAPIVDLSSGEVVGLQVAGGNLGLSFAVPTSELLRDARVADGIAASADAARPSTRAWQFEWGQADPAGDSPPVPSRGDRPGRLSASARQRFRDALIEQLSRDLGGADRFTRFLFENGHKDVVAAVPRVSSEYNYITSLVLALDRRELLDQFFLKNLQEELGLQLAFGEEPSSPARPAPGQLSAMSDENVNYVAQPSDWLPFAVRNDLTEAVRGSGVDNPDTVELAALGSKWRDWIVESDGRAATATETIERLAADPEPQSRQALSWLVGRFLHMMDASEGERVVRLARAYEHLVSGEKREIVSNLTVPADFEVADISYFSKGIEASRAVVLVEMPREGLLPGLFYGGTGWLVTPSLVVVPAHLIIGNGDQPVEVAVAEWRKRGIVRLDFDDRADANAKSRSVKHVELIDEKLDLAILRMDMPVTDRKPLQVNPEPPELEPGTLAMIHHPRLGPKKVSIRGGRLLESDSHQVIYTMATQVGSAGAPVFDMEWRVVATHRAYQSFRISPDMTPIRAKAGTTTNALLTALRGAGHPSGALWREVVAAQPGMKAIDPSLYVRLTQLAERSEPEVVSMIIRLVGPSTELANIPGLIPGSLNDQIVTATGTRESIDALAKLPEVVSIKASVPHGSLECADSVPHVGAIRVHVDEAEFGDKAIIGVIDNGIDIFHYAFRDDQKRTRVLAFWDQKDARARAGVPGVREAVSMSEAGREMVRKFKLSYGAVYVADDLQRFIEEREPLPASFPQAEAMEHGTMVCSIAAGRRTGDSDDDFSGGIAPKATLVVVRYDLQSKTVGYSRGHIDGLGFIEELAADKDLPVVVNISNGMNTGAHDGSSDLEIRCERFLADQPKRGRVIVKSAGNERGKGRHALISVAHGSVEELRWRSILASTDPDLEVATEMMELWFGTDDKFQFRLRPPTGDWSGPISHQFDELNEFLENGNHALGNLYPNENGGAHLRLEISRGNQAEVEGGTWTLEIRGTDVTHGAIHAWVEKTSRRNIKFLDYIEDRCTITVPGTAKHVITVGAVATADTMRPYHESSVGPARSGQNKPELVAPGVGLRAALAASERGIHPKFRPEPPSGTSLAAPHVAGAVALVLSARAKRPDLQQSNAMDIADSLRRTARHYNKRWNERTGYGELDVNAFFKDSVPKQKK